MLRGQRYLEDLDEWENSPGASDDGLGFAGMVLKLSLGFTGFVFACIGVYLWDYYRRQALHQRQLVLFYARQQEQQDAQNKIDEEKRAKAIKTELQTMNWETVRTEFSSRFGDDSSTARTSTSSDGDSKDMCASLSSCAEEDEATNDIEAAAAAGDSEDSFNSGKASFQPSEILVAENDLKRTSSYCSFEESEDSVTVSDNVASPKQPESDAPSRQRQESCNEDDCCHICLASFKDQDLVAISNNAKCRHVYHKDCISTWLLKHDECPACRQKYLETSEAPPEAYAVLDESLG